MPVEVKGIGALVAENVRFIGFVDSDGDEPTDVNYTRQPVSLVQRDGLWVNAQTVRFDAWVADEPRTLTAVLLASGPTGPALDVRMLETPRRPLQGDRPTFPEGKFEMSVDVT